MCLFTGIGQRQKGTYYYGLVKGCRSTGRCRVGIRKWTNDNGEELTFNEIKKFYEPDENQNLKQGSFKYAT